MFVGCENLSLNERRIFMVASPAILRRAGSFRATVRRYRIGHATYVKRYGAWMRVGYGPSIARCGSGEEAASGSGEHRV
jgi:hypothetical protein